MHYTQPNKLVKFVKDSFSSIFANSSPDVTVQSIEESENWSGNNETVCVKRTEYESLQNYAFNQTEVIKKLKRKDEESQSLIHEYEQTFSMVLQKSLERTKTRLDTSNSRDEIETLKSNEQRLKSHIQALKRDLLLAEGRYETEHELHELHEKKAQLLATELEAEKEQNRSSQMRIDELSFMNKECRIQLEKKCEELAEVIGLCRMSFENIP